MGARGWAYADVLPYYKRMECWDSRGHGGDASWRGTDGPLHVTRLTRENPMPFAFGKAGQQAGNEPVSYHPLILRPTPPVQTPV